MTVEAETERARRIWEKMAGAYDRSIALPERLLFSGGREWACSQAGGEVLEIAVGTGRNLAFYTPGVRLTGIDFSPAMMEIAGSRANDLDIRVSLRAADAQDLRFPNARFDTVVCSLGLCSIPDDRRAVSEAARMLRPRGAAPAPRARTESAASGERCPALPRSLHGSLPSRSLDPRTAPALGS